MNYNDVFNEQLVKRASTKKDLMKRVGIVAAAIILIGLVSVLVPQFGIIITSTR